MGGTTPRLRSRHSRRMLWRGSVSVGVILAFAGLLFTVNARLAAESPVRSSDDLPGLIESEQERLDQRAEAVRELTRQVDDLSGTGSDLNSMTNPDPIRIEAGSVAVIGPGVLVALWDAPSSAQSQTNNVDDLVVHQQDLQGVIDALWAGGAEAMTIQGQRVTSTTAVRCIGNTLLLHGRVYSPPYEIRAIGDSKKLRRTVMASTTVKTYLQYVERFELGWSLDLEDELTMPAYDGSWELKFARVPSSADSARSGS